MGRLSIASGVIVGLLLTGGCGKSEAEKKAEEAAQGLEQAAKGMEQMAKGMEQLAKGLPGASEGGAVEPVSFTALQELFPAMDGWEKGEPTGEKMSMPVPFSQAEVRYTRGDATIEAKIVDSGLNQVLLTPYAMFLAAGYEKQTTDGYEKSTKVAGHPGWETWNKDSHDGELNLVVGKRFLVTFEGNGIADTTVLHELAGVTNLARLAALK
jgi:X-X-X-Leu-X-X-Gly heptad repeat protein